MSYWAFLDHENVPDPQHIDLKRYERILVFCGPNSRKLNIDCLPGKGFCRLEFLRIGTQGKNNLDFHLAFHLGRLHAEAGPGIAFHIISADHGFDGLIEHMRELYRTCKRIEPTPPKPQPLSEAAQRVSVQLERAARSRPRKEASLLKWIANHVRNGETSPESILAELKQARQLAIQDGTVSYNFETPKTGAGSVGASP